MIYLGIKYLCFLVLLLGSYSCSKTNKRFIKSNLNPESPGNNLVIIDPRTFIADEFHLSQIADEITYIPLNNVIPIGSARSFKIMNSSIFLNLNDTLLVKFDINGNNPQSIGRMGRGPEEYFFCRHFAVENRTGNIYIKGKRDAILVYSPTGIFIREFQLPSCSDGSLFHAIEFLDSRLFMAQFIEMGKAQYNWIITDTLGNEISNKKNYLHPFVSKTGQTGGICKLNGTISYWDSYNDTVFSISTDFSYRPVCFFPPGNYRRRVEDIKAGSPQQFIEELTKICSSLLLFETTNYWVYLYRYNLYGVAFIDKRNNETKFNFSNMKSWGINNDLDAGTIFKPEGYYTANGNEYLIGMIDSYKLIANVASESFKNTKPKYPEKKKDLEKLANNLKETDNPVIIMVRLKK